MATPTEWLNEFQVNTGLAARGGQKDPHIIGLSNGNILVAWEEARNGRVARRNGTDIIGIIYDAEGNIVQEAFPLNTIRNGDDEIDFDIAATNDGGFVLVFVDDDVSTPTLTTIFWERFNRRGRAIDGAQLATNQSATDDLANPQVAVNQFDNSFVVTYTDPADGTTNIRARIVNSAGAATTEFNAAGNTAEFDRNGDVGILSNGNYVSVYEEDDGGTTSIEAVIFNPSGTAVVSAFDITGAGINGFDPEVATLTNGNFVVAYNRTGVGNGNIEYRIYNSSGSPLFGPFSAASSFDNENDPAIVALPDGDFVIAWNNNTDNTLEARRFNPNGTPDGSLFLIENTGTTTPNLGVTGDGRILATWDAQGGELFASIWDPRESPINAGDYDIARRNFVRSRVVTSLTTSSTVLGDSSNERIFGQAGRDQLRGNDGNDTIRGGAGKDNIIGGAGKDSLFGDSGKDKLKGGGGKDLLFGDNGKDRLIGGKGKDTLVGGGGGDKLIGGSGRDVFDYDSVADSRSGRSKRDTIVDFDRRKETIDLKNIDAKLPVSGNQKFKFIDNRRFSGSAGELRTTISGNKTQIFGDVNGNGRADFEILLKGSIDLSKRNFKL